MTDHFFQSLNYSCFTNPQVWMDRGNFYYITPTCLRYEFKNLYFSQSIGPLIYISSFELITRMSLYVSNKNNEFELFYSDNYEMNLKYPLPLPEIKGYKVYIDINFKNKIPNDLTLYCNFNDYIKYIGIKEILLEYPDNIIRICENHIRLAFNEPIYAKKVKGPSIISKIIQWIKNKEYHAIFES